MDDAALWTDSRYFLQAEQELSEEWQLMKEYMPETPTIAEWLKRKMSLLPNGGIVCVDGMVMPYEEITQLTKELRTIGCTMRTNYDALSTIWDNRPAKPSNDIFPVDSLLILHRAEPAVVAVVYHGHALFGNVQFIYDVLFLKL